MIVPAVPPHGQSLSRLYIPVKGDRRLFPGRNGVNGKFRSGVHIAAGKDIRLSGLIRQRIRLHGAVFVQLHPGSVQKRSPLDGLPNGQQHMFTFHRDRVFFIIPGSKSVVFVEYRGTFLEYDTCRFSVFYKDLLWTPGMMYGDTFLFGFFHFIGSRRHFFGGFQTVHLHISGTDTEGCPCYVHRHISAAHDHRLSVQLCLASQVHFLDKLDTGYHAPGILSGHIDLPSALSADGKVKALESLFPEAADGDVLPDLHAAPKFHAHFLQDLDLRFHHVLFQAERRNAVHQHTAGTLSLVKYHRRIAFFRQIKGAA